MTEDRSRYGKERLRPFERHLADGADKHAFTFRPWDTYGMNDQELVSHVQSELDSNGQWTAYGEMAMGGGMVARIDLVTVNGEQAFRAIGGDLMTTSATYRTLDRALDMVALFAQLGWEMIVATSWRDPEFIQTELNSPDL
jgi:hypothetical protein